VSGRDLEADMCMLEKSINRFFMKLFRTNNIDTVKTSQSEFGFKLPNTLLACRK